MLPRDLEDEEVWERAYCLGVSAGGRVRGRPGSFGVARWLVLAPPGRAPRAAPRALDPDQSRPLTPTPDPAPRPQEHRTEDGSYVVREPCFVTDASAKAEATLNPAAAARKAAARAARPAGADGARALLARRPIEHPLWKHETWTEVCVGGGFAAGRAN
jgi:hypothetical protein